MEVTRREWPNRPELLCPLVQRDLQYSSSQPCQALNFSNTQLLKELGLGGCKRKSIDVEQATSFKQ